MSRKFDYLGLTLNIVRAEHTAHLRAVVALSTTLSVLSRAVTRLEARLGRQLLQRTTRRVGLTEAGRAHLSRLVLRSLCLMTPNAFAENRRAN